MSFGTSVHAQYKNYNTESSIWHQGFVVTGEGRKISGTINYNFVVDQIRFKSASGEVKTLIPRNTRSFTLVDSTGTRVFHSLPHDLKKNGRKVSTFFQEIYRNKTYAILSKHHLDYNHSQPALTSSTPAVGTTTNRTDPNSYNNFNFASEKVIETLYLANRDGQIISVFQGKKATDWTRYLTHRTRYKDNKLKSSNLQKEVKKFRYIDNKHVIDQKLKSFFAKDYRQFERYVEANDIDLKTVGGLIESLSFQE